MILDAHIHITKGKVEQERLVNEMKAGGIDGGVLLSMRPAGTGSARERLDNLFKWTEGNPNLYPFFWIDPIESNAPEQVDEAVKLGVYGFKVICRYHYPGDSRAMGVYRKIAKAGKPVLFHSGILWDGKDSSKYNRPAEFESLLEVEGLRFALAHISWPWCDENIAVYGKFLNAYTTRPDLSVEMFIDTTPGTPPIYREEALTKLFTVGYDVGNNVIFGSDCSTESYSSKWAAEWVERDKGIFGKIGLSDEIKEKIFAGNLKRFLGIERNTIVKKSLRPAE